MRLIDPDELERVLRPILTDESCPLHIAAEIDMNLDLMQKVDAVPVVRCKDCSKWCICHHSENWFCADGTPINTTSDFYDDKGKRINNLQTYKSIHGERKDGDGND